MKRILLVLFGLIILVGVVAAYDYTLEGAGLGWGKGGYYDGIAKTVHSNFSANIYIQTKYPGQHNLSLNMTALACAGTAYSLNIYPLNCLGGICAWGGGSTLWYCDHTSAPFDGVVSVVSSSDQGVYLIQGSIGLTLRVAVSTATLIAADYSARSYAAGNSYVVPVLQRVYPGSVVHSVDVGGGIAKSALGASNQTSFFYNTFKPSCSLSDGVAEVYVTQTNTSNGAYYNSMYYANFTSIPDLNISSPSPSPNSMVDATGGLHQITFTITASQPSAVNCVTWYVHTPDNSTAAYPVQSNCNGGGYSYAFDGSGKSGVYRVSAQLEDNLCSRYPTVEWLVATGATTGTLIVLVGSNETGSWAVLVGASVLVSSNGLRFYNATTDSTGQAVIGKLGYGSYSVVATKSGYSSQSVNLTLSQSDIVSSVTLNLSFSGSGSPTAGSFSVAVVDSVSGASVHNFTATLDMATGTLYGTLIPLAQVSNNVLSSYGFGVTGTSDTISGNSVSFTNVPGGFYYKIYITKTGYTSAYSTLEFVSSSSNPSVTISMVPTITPTTIPVTSGSFTVNVYDSVSHVQVHNFNASLYSPAYSLVLPVAIVAGNTLAYSISGIGATADTVSGNSVAFTNVPNGAAYEVLVVAAGYNSAYSNLALVSAGSSVNMNVYLTPTNTTPIGGTTLEVSVSSGATALQPGTLYAKYMSNGQLIVVDGWTCTYSDPDLSPSAGTFTGRSGTIFYYVPVFFNATKLPSAPSTVSVTCYAPKYDSRTASFDFPIAAPNMSAMVGVSLVNAPTTALTNSTVLFSVRYFWSMDGAPVSDGACTFVFNGVNHSMTYNNPVQDSYSWTSGMLAAGQYTYYAACSRSNVKNTATVVKTLVVSDSVVIPPTCFDGVLDALETDVDCGGPGSGCVKCGDGKKCVDDVSCLSNLCVSGHCSSASCTDGTKDGLETGVDCGGGCSPCACFVSDDCAFDGSEECVGVSCIRSNCTGTTCSDLYVTLPYPQTKPRYCVGGTCKFASPGGFNTLFTITALTPFNYNDSGKTIWVSNCEEGTNGFGISAIIPVKTYYSFMDTGGLTPAVPVSNSATLFGSSEATTSVAGTFAGMCEIPQGSDSIYSLVTFQIFKPTSAQFEVASRYMLTFRERFRVNVTKASISGVGGILVNSTRPMTCKYRTVVTDAWTNISGAPSKAILVYNVSTTEKYYFVCNSSYGETATATYSGNDAFRLVGAAWNAGTVIGGAIFTGITGGDFIWVPYYIIPIGLFIVLGIPTLAIFGYFAYHRIKNA